MWGWFRKAGNLAALLVAVTAGGAAADILDTIKERKVISIGHRVDAPPFSYVGEDGEPRGLAVALCREIVGSLARQIRLRELDIRFVPVNATSRFDALTSGKSDLHCGPASATLKRREMLDFSILYFVDGAAAVVRRSTYDTVFDIPNARIGVAASTTTETMVRTLIEDNGMSASVVTFPNHQLGLETLARGRLDVYFGDSAIMRFQLTQRGLEPALELLPDTFSFEPYAIVMKRGESALRLAVDRALSEIYDSGLIYTLIQDTLGQYRLSPLNRAVYQIVGLPG
ncbi:MAG: amino acid ABC transporter substrate-binding protein [Pseudomonadota bacterium]